MKFRIFLKRPLGRNLASPLEPVCLQVLRGTLSSREQSGQAGRRVWARVSLTKEPPGGPGAGRPGAAGVPGQRAAHESVASSGARFPPPPCMPVAEEEVRAEGMGRGLGCYSQ